MGQHPRLTPWKDWDEWSLVRNGLYSRDISEQIWALEVISMWRTRGRIPHSVDSSSQLVEVIINDLDPPCTQFCQPQRSESEIRLMYSIAIVRGVNGLVDQSQQGYFADSVMSLAVKLGLPAWFVELRHEATHNQLPALRTLRSAAKNLLLWYRDSYWDRQQGFLDSLVVHSDGETGAVFSKGSTSLCNVLIPRLLANLRIGLEGEQQHWWPLVEKALDSHPSAGGVLLRRLCAEGERLIKVGEGAENVVWWCDAILSHLKSSKPTGEILCPPDCIARLNAVLPPGHKDKLQPFLGSSTGHKRDRHGVPLTVVTNMQRGHSTQSAASSTPTATDDEDLQAIDLGDMRAWLKEQGDSNPPRDRRKQRRTLPLGVSSCAFVEPSLYLLEYDDT